MVTKSGICTKCHHPGRLSRPCSPAFSTSCPGWIVHPFSKRSTFLPLAISIGLSNTSVRKTEAEKHGISDGRAISPIWLSSPHPFQKITDALSWGRVSAETRSSQTSKGPSTKLCSHGLLQSTKLGFDMIKSHQILHASKCLSNPSSLQSITVFFNTY